MPRGGGPLRHPPHVELRVGMYISTTAAQQQAAVLQLLTAKAARTASDPPTRPPKDPPCTAAQQGVQQQYVSSCMQPLIITRVVCCLHHIENSMFLPCFPHVFTIPRHIGGWGRLLSTLPAPHPPSLELAPVLSPAAPRAAVWGGRSTVAGSRGRSEEPFQNHAF